MHWVDGWDELACWEAPIHFISVITINTDFLSCVFGALSILRYLPFGHNMIIPWFGDVSQSLFIVSEIHLKNASIEIHVFQLENIFTIVTSSFCSCQCFLLTGSQVWKLSIFSNVPQNVFLFDFDLVDVRNYLYTHRTLALLELKLLVFLVGFNDLRDLCNAV